MKIKPKLREKVIREFYEFILKDLVDREEEVKRLTESGDFSIGSLNNEQELGNLVRQVVSGYVLRYLKDDVTTN